MPSEGIQLVAELLASIGITPRGPAQQAAEATAQAREKQDGRSGRPAPASDRPAGLEGARADIERRGWAVVHSETLGERVLWLRDERVVPPEPWRQHVGYTLAELEALRGATKDDLRLLHAAKRVFGGRILRGAPASALREEDAPRAAGSPPSRPCYTCGHRDWWRRPGGPWTCAVCHPPAVAPVERVTGPEPAAAGAAGETATPTASGRSPPDPLSPKDRGIGAVVKTAPATRGVAFPAGTAPSLLAQSSERRRLA